MYITVKGWMQIFALVITVGSGILILNLIQDPLFAKGIRGGVAIIGLCLVQWGGHIFQAAKSVKE